MSAIQLRQIQNEASKRFLTTEMSSLLRRNDIKTVDAGCMLSRALAAYAIWSLAPGLDDQDYAMAVMDHGDDNGIDAILADERQRCLYIVQSKWSHKGRGGIQKAEILNFLNGADDLFELRRDKFGKHFDEIWDALESCLDSAKWRYRLVFAHSRIELMSEGQSLLATKRIDEWNSSCELVEFDELNQSRLHEALVRDRSDGPIDLTATLCSWGVREEPVRAFYGQVSVAEVADWWTRHRDRLFRENLRYLLADSSINTEIRDTAIRNPADFWYLNNGITLLCDSIRVRLFSGHHDTSLRMGSPERKLPVISGDSQFS